MKLLEKAIQLEVDAGHFYHQQAEKNQGTPIETAFNILASEELEHREILKKIQAGSAPSIDENQVSESESFFGKLGDFKTAAGYPADQLEVYRAAMTMEQNSVELYREMEKEATESKELRILGFLVKQEQLHFRLLEALEKLLSRPAEWVEAAEFGHREEY